MRYTIWFTPSGVYYGQTYSENVPLRWMGSAAEFVSILCRPDFEMGADTIIYVQDHDTV